MRELAEKTGLHERTIFDYENVRKPREMSIYKVERILASLGYEMDFYEGPGRPGHQEAPSRGLRGDYRCLGISDLPAPARQLLFLIR